MKSFKGQTVLVTGASSGIGEAFSRNLAQRGSNLVLVARSADKLAHLAKTLGCQYGVRLFYFPFDLTLDDSPQRLFDEVQASGLSVDVLINNAGFGYWGNFSDGNLQNYKNMVNLNIQAMVSLSYLFLPSMLKRRCGGIINVGSIVGFQPMPYGSVYVGSKAFVLHYSESLWGECKRHGVTVTALCPSTTDTNFFNISIPDQQLREMRMLNMPRSQSPDFVAEVGLNQFLKGKNHVIPGKMNYLMAQGSQLLLLTARRFAIKVAASFFDPNREK